MDLGTAQHLLWGLPFSLDASWICVCHEDTAGRKGRVSGGGELLPSSHKASSWDGPWGWALGMGGFGSGLEGSWWVSGGAVRG